MEEVGELLLNNQHHVFVQYINKHILKIENKCIALILGYLRFKGQPFSEIDDLIDSIFDDIADNLEVQRSIVSGRNELIVNGII